MSNPTVTSASAIQPKTSPPSPLSNRSGNSVEAPKVEVPSVSMDSLTSTLDKLNGAFNSLDKDIELKPVENSEGIQVEVRRKSTSQILKIFSPPQIFVLMSKIDHAVGMLVNVNT